MEKDKNDRKKAVSEIIQEHVKDFTDEELVLSQKIGVAVLEAVSAMKKEYTGDMSFFDKCTLNALTVNREMIRYLNSMWSCKKPPERRWGAKDPSSYTENL